MPEIQISILNIFQGKLHIDFHIKSYYKKTNAIEAAKYFYYKHYLFYIHLGVCTKRSILCARITEVDTKPDDDNNHRKIS